MGVRLDGPRTERAVGLLAEFAAGIPARNATLLARFVRRPPAEVLAEFNRLVTTPKARRALSILMSQASALPVLSLQMKMPLDPNGIRPQAVDTRTLPGAGQFVSRGMDPELFMWRGPHPATATGFSK